MSRSVSTRAPTWPLVRRIEANRPLEGFRRLLSVARGRVRVEHGVLDVERTDHRCGLRRPLARASVKLLEQNDRLSMQFEYLVREMLEAPTVLDEAQGPSELKVIVRPKRATREPVGRTEVWLTWVSDKRNPRGRRGQRRDLALDGVHAPGEHDQEGSGSKRNERQRPEQVVEILRYVID